MGIFSNLNANSVVNNPLQIRIFQYPSEQQLKLHVISVSITKAPRVICVITKAAAIALVTLIFFCIFVNQTCTIVDLLKRPTLAAISL